MPSATRLSLLETLAKWSPRARRVSILVGHDVTDGGWFSAFLQGLIDRGHRFVPLTDLIESHRDGIDLPGAMALTFDDGCRSLETIIEPVCQQLRVPYTTFACGDVATGGPAPWFLRFQHLAAKAPIERLSGAFRSEGYSGQPAVDALRSHLKTLPVRRVVAALDRAERDLGVTTDHLREEFLPAARLRRLVAGGLATIGCHTSTHPVLSNLSSEEQREEIERGLQQLQGADVPVVKILAYPDGWLHTFTQETKRHLRELGFLAAVTTVERPLKRVEDRFALPRLGFDDRYASSRLALKQTVPYVSPSLLLHLLRTRGGLGSSRGRDRALDA